MEKLAIPEPAPYEILVQVEAVGVCASDGKCWVGAEVYWGKPGGLGSSSIPTVNAYFNFHRSTTFFLSGHLEALIVCKFI